MIFDSLDFVGDGPDEAPFTCLAIYILEEGGNIRIDAGRAALAVQKYLCSLIAERKGNILQTALIEGVYGEIPLEKIEGADEYNIGRIQFRVIMAFAEHVHIDHGLIITGALSERAVLSVGRLHFYIVDGSRVILDIDIQSDAFAVQADINGFFFIGVGDFLDFYL